MATKTSSKPSAAKRKSKPPAAKLDAPVSVAPPTPALDGALLIATPAARPDPTHDEIASRAFELYQLRAHAEGGELHDWLAAERELRAS